MKIRFLIILISFIYMASCSGGKIPGADARKISPNPKDRVQKNLEEGRGFRLLEITRRIRVNLILQVQMNYGELL